MRRGIKRSLYSSFHEQEITALSSLIPSELKWKETNPSHIPGDCDGGWCVHPEMDGKQSIKYRKYDKISHFPHELSVTELVYNNNIQEIRRTWGERHSSSGKLIMHTAVVYVDKISGKWYEDYKDAKNEVFTREWFDSDRKLRLDTLQKYVQKNTRAAIKRNPEMNPVALVNCALDSVKDMLRFEISEGKDISKPEWVAEAEELIRAHCKPYGPSA